MIFFFASHWGEPRSTKSARNHGPVWKHYSRSHNRTLKSSPTFQTRACRRTMPQRLFKVVVSKHSQPEREKKKKKDPKKWLPSASLQLLRRPFGHQIQTGFKWQTWSQTGETSCVLQLAVLTLQQHSGLLPADFYHRVITKAVALLINPL